MLNIQKQLSRAVFLMVYSYHMKFGFFDSGLGGLLLMRSCMQQIPDHSYVYVGDTKNLPYGPRESQEICGLMTPYLLYLFQSEQCDYVVVACNTACARALPLFLKIHPEYTDRCINIISLTQYVLGNNSFKDVVLLGTQGTINSGIYTDVNDSIHAVAMPGLVEVIEQGMDLAAIAMVRDVLMEYPECSDLFLCCTHYVYLRETLRGLYPNISIHGQDEYVRDCIQDLISGVDLDQDHELADVKYFVSGDPNVYQNAYGISCKKIIL